MSLTVYGIAASRASRTLWMLEELGLAYEHVHTDFKGGATRQSEFLAINPNGHIPVLVDGEIVVWESMATTLYLARKFGGTLAPATLPEEAEALRWSFWVVTECEKDALSVLFHRVVMAPDQRRPALADAAEKALAKPFAVLDGHLADREYLFGERFSVADINVASVLSWTGAAPHLLHAHANVDAWLKRCLARPAQKKIREMARAGR